MPIRTLDTPEKGSPQPKKDKRFDSLKSVVRHLQTKVENIIHDQSRTGSYVVYRRQKSTDLFDYVKEENVDDINEFLMRETAKLLRDIPRVKAVVGKGERLILISGPRRFLNPIAKTEGSFIEVNPNPS